MWRTHYWWEIKMVQLLWKIIGQFLKKLKQSFTIQLRNSASGYIYAQEKQKHKNFYVNFQNSVHNYQEVETSQMSIS